MSRQQKNTGTEDLRKRLTPMQYHVTQEKGTEAPFSGEHYASKESGMYTCVVCGHDLFSSDTKYDSGSGWPSFYEPVQRTNIAFVPDGSHGMTRAEVKCSQCGAHLGHMFDDGPLPTGQRYCINSAALTMRDSTAKTAHASDDKK